VNQYIQILLVDFKILGWKEEKEMIIWFISHIPMDHHLEMLGQEKESNRNLIHIKIPFKFVKLQNFRVLGGGNRR